MGVHPVCALCSHTEGEHGTSGCSNGWGTDCRGCKCASFVLPVRTLDEMFGGPPLTPSEVFAAKALAAWVEWPGRATGSDTADLQAVALHEALYQARLISPGAVTLAGESLLARARKAGVL